MAFPALTQTRSSRMNKPYEDNSSQLNLARSVIFAMIQNLIDTAAGGTLTGTRDADSLWTVKGSSNSASVSLVGVNHIAARTNLVWAAASSPHSWIWLENAALGYQVVLDCVNATNTNFVGAAARIATPFTGGTINNRPTSTEEFLWATTSIGDSPVTFLSDVTLGATCYTHFITGEDGQFLFLASRAGTGIVHLAVGLMKTIDADVADVRNVFWIGSSSTSGRGSCTAGTIGGTSSGAVGRTTNGAAVVNTGGAGQHNAGGSALSGGGTYGTDALSGKYNATPVPVWSANSAALYAYRGMLPDVYTTTAQVGQGITNAGTVERIVVGDYIFACPGVAPTV